ncbi:hypothetical protein V7094_28570 [Priestia megaterium]|uniref:hypothetical protein n=1 Tax=Priestia megaterium TaxID=1404 RepID=UPI003000DBE1
MKFYTVSANFDMVSSGSLEIKSFLLLENANNFAREQWKEFLSEIPEGKLDPMFTEEEITDGRLFFYGTSEDGENIVTIRVNEATFEDK